jgi:hypothetical protein
MTGVVRLQRDTTASPSSYVNIVEVHRHRPSRETALLDPGRLA